MGPYLDGNLPGDGSDAGRQEDTEKALDVMRLVWGDEYLFDFDPEHGWWAMKNGRIGTLRTANSPEELGQQLSEEPGAGQ